MYRTLLAVAVLIVSLSSKGLYSVPEEDTPKSILKPVRDENIKPEESQDEKEIVPEVKAAEKKYPPSAIMINDISMFAPIVPAGETSDGKQAVPEDNSTASWWKLGSFPGETGSAVLAGHYKIDDGSPGVFHRLNELGVGDEIKILSANDNEIVFKIIDMQVYSREDFPLQKVYADKSGKYLNLITCAGRFITQENDYANRLVVFAEFVGD